MKTLITIRRTDKPTPPPPPDNLYIIKADQYTYSWNFQVRSVAPNPAVNRTGEIGNPSNFRRAAFTAKWQFFWADLLSMRVYGKLFSELSTSSFVQTDRAPIVEMVRLFYSKVVDFLSGTEKSNIINLFNAITSSTRFLNNSWGTNNCNNYVTGQMRDRDPVIDPLVCAGPRVEVLEVRTSTSGKTTGLHMARLKSFNENDTPPVVTQEFLDNDPRVLRATVINEDGELTDFPQIYQKFPELSDYWVPYPYVSKDDCWFPLRDLEKV